MEKKVLVTGGNGFLGSYVVEKLLHKGYIVSSPRGVTFDLRNREEVKRLYKYVKPDIVVHLAAVCGGIGANQDRPGTFLYDNAVMGLEMIHAAIGKIQKFVQVGTVCAYPKFTPVPFKEENIWDGYPEETNAPYGLAKKLLLAQCQAYRQQYGLNAIYLVPVNLYGPRDNFDTNTSHVIPALIKKCLEAKREGKDSIEVWGTGTASREFLYVEDCADAIVKATETYNEPKPINIGSGSEIKICDLVKLVAYATGFKGNAKFDPSRPDGQPRRVLDVSKAISAFGFRATTGLSQGILKTVQWYKENSHSNI